MKEDKKMRTQKINIVEGTKLNIIKEIEPKKDPNLAGEALRDHFFDQSKGRGCYYSFDMNPHIVSLPKLEVDPEEEAWSYKLFWNRFHDPILKIECRYYWDGDGTLVFILPDGSCVWNNDCKKDHVWEWYPSFEAGVEGDF